jgi:FMN phosphatase YigB (HAD superfamily)
MVGDSLDDDIDGALALGMQAVLVDRLCLRPDYAPRVESLADLSI